MLPKNYVSRGNIMIMWLKERDSRREVDFKGIGKGEGLGTNISNGVGFKEKGAKL